VRVPPTRRQRKDLAWVGCLEATTPPQVCSPAKRMKYSCAPPIGPGRWTAKWAIFVVALVFLLTDLA